MIFTTTLFKAIFAASTISLNGYEGDNYEIKRFDPKDTSYLVEFDLRDFDQFIWTFRDQEVEVDSDGFCKAKCTEGNAHSFEFRVSHPIAEEDLM